MGNPNWTKGCPSPNPNGRPSAAVEDRLKLIRDGIKPHVPAIIDAMAEKAAKGCPQSAKLVMQYFLPPSQLSETRLTGTGALAYLPPDQRLNHINTMVALGTMSVEAGQALTLLAKVEVESRVYEELRRLTALLRKGEDMQSVVDQLLAIDVPAKVVKEGKDRPLMEYLA